MGSALEKHAEMTGVPGKVICAVEGAAAVTGSLQKCF